MSGFRDVGSIGPLLTSWHAWLQHNKEPVLSWKVLRHVARQHVRLHTLVAEKKDLEEVVWSLFPQVSPPSLQPADLSAVLADVHVLYIVYMQHLAVACCWPARCEGGALYGTREGM